METICINLAYGLLCLLIITGYIATVGLLVVSMAKLTQWWRDEYDNKRKID